MNQQDIYKLLDAMGDSARACTEEADAATLRQAEYVIKVMMEHLTKAGDSKIVERCVYPLTGVGCVTRIYTDLAVIDVTPQGLVLREVAEDTTVEAVRAATGATLHVRGEVGRF